jgi:uncharacterized protein with PIN domain
MEIFHVQKFLHNLVSDNGKIIPDRLLIWKAYRKGSPKMYNQYKTAGAGNNAVVSVRFYAELNDFIKPAFRQREIEITVKGRVTVKNAVESLGVPHSAIDLVLVNGGPVDFGHLVRPGDYISVYPEFESFDVSGISRNRKKPLRISRFIADAHLGKLATKLRMLGFDTLFSVELSDDEIINLASTQKRIILTRDREMLKSGQVDHGYYVRSVHPVMQLNEVIDKFDLTSQFRPFTRCLKCNGKLETVCKREAEYLVPEETASLFQSFFRCSGCGRIYWEGSHYERMKAEIKSLGWKE